LMQKYCTKQLSSTAHPGRLVLARNTLVLDGHGSHADAWQTW
jgi:hypothetical protein